MSPTAELSKTGCVWQTQNALLCQAGICTGSSGDLGNAVIKNLLRTCSSWPRPGPSATCRRPGSRTPSISWRRTCRRFLCPFLEVLLHKPSSLAGPDRCRMPDSASSRSSPVGLWWKRSLAFLLGPGDYRSAVCEEFRDIALRFLNQLRPSQLDLDRSSLGISSKGRSLRWSPHRSCYEGPAMEVLADCVCG